MRDKLKCVLTIAGSDSGAGAGIQSDLKTFHNHGVYGVTVITSITAQNTLGVSKTFELPLIIIKGQLKSIFEDFDIKVAKTGMLSSGNVVSAIANDLVKRKNLKIIVDPIILSKNKYSLLDRKGIDVLRKELMPVAFMVTPNIHEAEVLSRLKINSFERIHEAAIIIQLLGCKYVLIKGGHLSKSIRLKKGTDILFDGREFTYFESEFIKTKNTHGSGCVLSAAIAANIALDKNVKLAVKEAKKYLMTALKRTKRIGKGYSPVEQVR